MNRLFNIFRRKKVKGDTSFHYQPPEQLPIEELMKRNTNPYDRFDDVLKSSTEGRQLQEIYRKVKNNVPIENTEIVDMIKGFATSQQSNAIYIAELLLVTITPLCYYRPELTVDLLIYPLRAFYYGTGSTDYDYLVSFIREHLIDYKLTPYGGLPPGKEIEWLTEELPRMRGTIQEVFDQVVTEDSEQTSNQKPLK